MCCLLNNAVHSHSDASTHERGSSVKWHVTWQFDTEVLKQAHLSREPSFSLFCTRACSAMPAVVSNCPCGLSVAQVLLSSGVVVHSSVVCVL
jgi:hypothetical protein